MLRLDLYDVGNCLKGTQVPFRRASDALCGTAKVLLVVRLVFDSLLLCQMAFLGGATTTEPNSLVPPLFPPGLGARTCTSPPKVPEVKIEEIPLRDMADATLRSAGKE